MLWGQHQRVPCAVVQRGGLGVLDVDLKLLDEYLDASVEPFPTITTPSHYSDGPKIAVYPSLGHGA